MTWPTSDPVTLRTGRHCGAPRSSPPSGPPRSTRRCSRGWSRPAWTWRASTFRTAAAPSTSEASSRRVPRRPRMARRWPCSSTSPAPSSVSESSPVRSTCAGRDARARRVSGRVPAGQLPRAPGALHARRAGARRRRRGRLPCARRHAADGGARGAERRQRGVTQGRQPAGHAAADQRPHRRGPRPARLGPAAGRRLRRALLRPLRRRRARAQGAHRRRRRRPAGGRQDREEGGPRRLRGDHRRGRRRDGRARRPRRRDRPGDGAGLAEAHHPRGQRRRQAGDHRDADAAVHDRRPATDAGGGERRRQRHLRRDRRRDALRRDGRRRLPRRGGAHHGRDRARGRGGHRARGPRAPSLGPARGRASPTP